MRAPPPGARDRGGVEGHLCCHGQQEGHHGVQVGHGGGRLPGQHGKVLHQHAVEHLHAGVGAAHFACVRVLACMRLTMSEFNVTWPADGWAYGGGGAESASAMVRHPV